MRVVDVLPQQRSASRTKVIGTTGLSRTTVGAQESSPTSSPERSVGERAGRAVERPRPRTATGS